MKVKWPRHLNLRQNDGSSNISRPFDHFNSGTNLVKLSQITKSPGFSLPQISLSACCVSTHFLHSTAQPCLPGPHNGGGSAFLDTRDTKRRKLETGEERGSVTILNIQWDFHYTQRHLYSTGIGWGYIYNMHSVIYIFCTNIGNLFYSPCLIQSQLGLLAFWGEVVWEWNCISLWPS